LSFGQTFTVSVVYEWYENADDVVFEVGLSRADGQRVVTLHSIDGAHGAPTRVIAGRQEVTVEMNDVTLLPGEFTIDAGCHRMNGNTIDYLNRVLRFEALNGDEGQDRYPWAAVRGYVRPGAEWRGHDVAGLNAQRATR
jgi:Wzt C-terminal domain